MGSQTVREMEKTVNKYKNDINSKANSSTEKTAAAALCNYIDREFLMFKEQIERVNTLPRPEKRQAQREILTEKMHDSLSKYLQKMQEAPEYKGLTKFFMGVAQTLGKMFQGIKAALGMGPKKLEEENINRASKNAHNTSGNRHG